MRRRYGKILNLFVFMSLFVGLLMFLTFPFNTGKRISGKVRRNHLKPDFLNMMRPSNNDLDLDRKSEKWLMQAIHDSLPAGRLVCQRRKGRPPGALSDYPEAAIDIRIARRKSARFSMTRLSPKRLIGCCPPGDPRGLPYKVGSACCVDKIFDVSTHFCCTESEQVMPLTPENLEDCHPLREKHTCRVQDLESTSVRGLEINCKLNSANNPVHCEFRCPRGSKPKNGITSSACTAEGSFDRIPECCQGCSEDFRLNLIFLLQLSINPTEDNSDTIRQSLTDFISHFKIGQENVRVGFRIVGSERQRVFHLNAADATKAIDVMDLNVAESNNTLGNAMNSITAEFTQLNIERPEVGNVAVLILQEPPIKSTTRSSNKLKEVAKVLTIAAGKKISTTRLLGIATSFKDIFQITDITRLNDISNNIHNNVCGTGCIF